MEKQFIFYKVTYINDGRVYYGSHYGYLKDSYRGSNKIIHAIIKKHGINSLSRENLKIFTSKKEMYDFESRFLSIHKLDKNPKCLNFTTNGCGGDTWSHMTESEKAIRKKIMSDKLSGAGNGNYNREFTEEHKQKISESKKGKPIFTDEHKQKISERVKKEYSEGTRDNNFLKQFSNNRKGTTLTEEHKQLISIKMKSSEKYKDSRKKAAETIHIKFIERLNIFKKLINEGYSKEYILKELNIKSPTWYKYKRLLK